MFKYSAFIVTEILLIPYLGWGIYLLRRRLRFQDEFSTPVEGLTLLGAILFCALQIYVMRVWLAAGSLGFLFAFLGVLVSGAALYGHVAVSFLSKLIVDTFVPQDEGRGDRPRLGPAEALERQGDNEGALQEYLVLARIYPHAAIVHTRVAENLILLDRADEAPDWYRRALKVAPEPASALPVLYRLCELYEAVLDRPEDAGHVLLDFVQRHPDAPEAALVRARLEHGQAGEQHPETPALQALEAAPLIPMQEADEQQDALRAEVGLDSMEELLGEEVDGDLTVQGEVELASSAGPHRPEAQTPWTLEPLQENEPPVEEVDDAPPSASPFQLDAMEDAPKKPIKSRKRKPKG